jgi:uncharacterized protein
MSKSFYEKGLKFECQGSGKCCVSRGEYGFVYLTKRDQKVMSKHLNLSLVNFKKLFVKETDNVPHLVQPKDTEDCIFLKNKRCDVYEARPVQCKTWPFWPENMNAKSWKRDVVAFCPGARVKEKAAIRGPKEIEIQLKIQTDAEKELFGEG